MELKWEVQRAIRSPRGEKAIDEVHPKGSVLVCLGDRLSEMSHTRTGLSRAPVSRVAPSGDMATLKRGPPAGHSLASDAAPPSRRHKRAVPLHETEASKSPRAEKTNCIVGSVSPGKRARILSDAISQSAIEWLVPPAASVRLSGEKQSVWAGSPWGEEGFELGKVLTSWPVAKSHTRAGPSPE